MSGDVAVVASETTAVRKDVHNTRSDVQGVKTAIEDALNMANLNSLPRAKLASYRSGRPNPPNPCFEGTRTQILQDIATWVAHNDPSLPRVYCLNGIAGVGKTTIARTVAERAETEGVLGADFFFSRSGEAELRNPALVFPTLAYQLARFERNIARRISGVIADDADIGQGTLRDQLQKLIIGPLSSIKSQPLRSTLR